MAFLPDEVDWFKKTADDMAQRIEDFEKTSEQASVVFSGIGRLCTRAVAIHAATEAKKATRSSQVTKFQTARQTRRDRKKQKVGSAAPSASQTQTRAPSSSQSRA